MENACVEIARLSPRQVLLRYDAAAHAEKVKQCPNIYAANSADVEVVSASTADAFRPILDFITSAQQQCYVLFGETMQKSSVDDDAGSATEEIDAEEASIPINSSEWSEDDRDSAVSAARKRLRT